ncbi:MAG: hypothetical protein AAF544_14090 [Bacteroidota bacterium]
MKRINIASFVLAMLFAVPALAGGGWPQPKGGGYFKLSQWWVIADQHFTGTGGLDPNVTQAIWNTSLYGEYGITDRLTGIVYFPFFSRTYFNNLVSGTTGEVLVPGEAINGLGDTDLSLKYGLLNKGGFALSTTLTFGLPLGNPSGGTAGNLQTGDGEFNQLLQFDLGKSFSYGELPAYANVYAGFNNRTQGFSDEIRFGVETGVQLLDSRLLVLVRAFGVQSLQNGTLTAENSTSIFANNSEHFTIAPEVAWQFNDKWGVSASYSKAVSGRIIFANPAYSAGVYVKL